ncbi:hypothetical protein EMCRGX_G020182 [Ephydatia muelleri]
MAAVLTSVASSKCQYLSLLFVSKSPGGMYFYTAIGPTALLTIGTDQESEVYGTEYGLLSLIKWYHVAGLVTFVWSSWHQYRCHQILADLRSPGATGNHSTPLYSIPRGDWFELVSSPHYLAEVLIYASLVLFTGGHNPGFFLVLVFTILVLLLSARQAHDCTSELLNDMGVHDMGARDMGAHDMGARDMGAHDMGARDMGAHDMGAHDMGARDMGAHDMGARDMGAHDMGARDMGAHDMGARDMGARDMGAHDMGAHDMGARDMGARDMGAHDIGVQDIKI